MAINAVERLAVQLPPYLVYKKHLTLTVFYKPYTEVQLVGIQIDKSISYINCYREIVSSNLGRATYFRGKYFLLTGNYIRQLSVTCGMIHTWCRVPFCLVIKLHGLSVVKGRP